MVRPAHCGDPLGLLRDYRRAQGMLYGDGIIAFFSSGGGRLPGLLGFPVSSGEHRGTESEENP